MSRRLVAESVWVPPSWPTAALYTAWIDTVHGRFLKFGWTSRSFEDRAVELAARAGVLGVYLHGAFVLPRDVAAEAERLLKQVVRSIGLAWEPSPGRVHDEWIRLDEGRSRGRWVGHGFVATREFAELCRLAALQATSARDQWGRVPDLSRRAAEALAEWRWLGLSRTLAAPTPTSAVRRRCGLPSEHVELRVARQASRYRMTLPPPGDGTELVRRLP